MTPIDSISDPKAKRWGFVAKYAALLGVGFLVAPYVFTAITGLIGLIAAGGLMLGTWMLMPTVEAMAANLRLKLLKGEAARNPVETLQGEHLRQSERLEERKKGLDSMNGAIRTLDQAIDSLQADSSRTKATAQQVAKDLAAQEAKVAADKAKLNAVL